MMTNEILNQIKTILALLSRFVAIFENSIIEFKKFVEV